MNQRMCIVCARRFIGNGSRCREHATYRDTHNPAYDTAAWRTLRRRTLEEHRRTVGDICPGWRRAPHATARLSVDHITPLVRGGAIDGPVQVLCVSCNSRKAHDDRPRSPRTRTGGAR